MAIVTAGPPEPYGSLGVTKSGHAQLTGCGDEDFLRIRADADGTISTSRTLLDSGGTIPNGAIDVHAFRTFGVFLDLTQGSLTSAIIDFEFSDRDQTAWFKQAVRTSSVSGVHSIAAYSFSMNFTALQLCFNIPTMCAHFMRAYLKGSGVVTNSSANIYILRGWGESLIQS